MILTAKTLREAAGLLREYASHIKSDSEGTQSFEDPKGNMGRQYRKALRMARRLERLAKGGV